MQEFVISQRQEMDSPPATPTRSQVVSTTNHMTDIKSEKEATSAVNKAEPTKEDKPKNTTPKKAASPTKGIGHFVSDAKIEKALLLIHICYKAIAIIFTSRTRF